SRTGSRSGAGSVSGMISRSSSSSTPMSPRLGEGRKTAVMTGLPPVRSGERRQGGAVELDLGLEPETGGGVGEPHSGDEAARGDGRWVGVVVGARLAVEHRDRDVVGGDGGGHVSASRLTMIVAVTRVRGSPLGATRAHALPSSRVNVTPSAVRIRAPTGKRSTPANSSRENAARSENTGAPFMRTWPR